LGGSTKNWVNLEKRRFTYKGKGLKKPGKYKCLTIAKVACGLFAMTTTLVLA
jgi:hypothetical protein